MLKQDERHFLEHQRVAHFATADDLGQPHVVPVCYAVLDNAVYFSIDEKPKRQPRRPLKRVQNILANPKVSIVVDRYDEDWQRLAWVMLRGRAELLQDGEEHKQAQVVLKTRYAPLREMRIDNLPVVKTTITAVTSWGAITYRP